MRATNFITVSIYRCMVQYSQILNENSNDQRLNRYDKWQICILYFYIGIEDYTNIIKQLIEYAM